MKMAALVDADYHLLSVMQRMGIDGSFGRNTIDEECRRCGLDTALVRLASAIERLIGPCHEAQKKVIWKFFSDYKTELERHFEVEEGQVIPYVQGLLIGRSWSCSCSRGCWSRKRVRE